MPLYGTSIELSPSAFGKLAQLRPGFIMFYANWCPHCTAMVSTWEALHQKYKDRFSVMAMDCAAGTPKAEEVCRQFGVNGYPTIKIWNNGRLTDYSGGRDMKSLEQKLLSLGAMKSGGGKRITVSTTRHSCTGKTADGKACKRQPASKCKRCWQHKA